MAYEKHDWECGEVVSEELLNHIERGISDMNESYVPTVWESGDIVTADKLNKIENGIANGCSCDGIAVDDIAMRTVSDAISGSASFIAPRAFESWGIVAASFPDATYIADEAFANCLQLTEVSFPNVMSIGQDAFISCSALTTASFPNASIIGITAFCSCTSLAEAYFSNATSISDAAFLHCHHLESLYLLGSSVVSIGMGVFFSTPMALSTYLGHFGSVYVPASLVDAYKSAQNWSALSSRITAYIE